LEVFDEAGHALGTVTDLIETGAHDVLVIAPLGGGKELLLPNHADVVLDVRPKERQMTVRPLIYDE
ncbi:MAG: ribosome maturation factor RimM, partial [Thermomicrobiales bacterium]